MSNARHADEITPALLRSWADAPTEHGWQPISAGTLRKIADMLERPSVNASVAVLAAEAEKLTAALQAKGFENPYAGVIVSDSRTVGAHFSTDGGRGSSECWSDNPERALKSALDFITKFRHRWTDADVAATLGIEETGGAS